MQSPIFRDLKTVPITTFPGRLQQGAKLSTCLRDRAVRTHIGLWEQIAQSRDNRIRIHIKNIHRELSRAGAGSEQPPDLGVILRKTVTDNNPMFSSR